MTSFDLEDEIMLNTHLRTKIRERDDYAQNMYAAICNMQWCKREMWPLLKGEYWTRSWRAAGGMIARIQNKGDYMDWYCSGMGGVASYDVDADNKYMESRKYVPEGVVTEEIQQDLYELGWIPVPYPDVKYP